MDSHRAKACTLTRETKIKDKGEREMAAIIEQDGGWVGRERDTDENRDKLKNMTCVHPDLEVERERLAFRE